MTPTQIAAKNFQPLPQPAAVHTRIRLSKSTVGPLEANAVAQAVQRGYFGMGADVQAFENELAEFIGGNRHVMAVSSGTAAVQLAVQACGIGPGDEVLVPTLTFVATFQAISATGATPVACDTEPRRAQLDVSDAARRITPRTRAIVPVHYASCPGDLDQVYELAAAHGLRVIEDAAHAFGGYYNGRRVGATGDVVCFSFDGIKNITSGEGGAVVTSDSEVAERVRDARLLGVEKDTDKRYAGARSWEFDVTHQGWRYHMSNIFAALGRTQLRRFDPEFAPRRVSLATRYVEKLRGLPGLRLLDIQYGAVVPHIFPVLIEDNRDAVRRGLLEEGIESGIHYKPNHLLSRFRSSQPLAVAEKLYSQLLSLPLHADLTESDQDQVVASLRQHLEG